VVVLLRVLRIFSLAEKKERTEEFFGFVFELFSLVLLLKFLVPQRSGSSERMPFVIYSLILYQGCHPRENGRVLYNVLAQPG
jgi:hypothetical protein